LDVEARAHRQRLHQGDGAHMCRRRRPREARPSPAASPCLGLTSPPVGHRCQASNFQETDLGPTAEIWNPTLLQRRTRPTEAAAKMSAVDQHQHSRAIGQKPEPRKLPPQPRCLAGRVVVKPHRGAAATPLRRLGHHATGEEEIGADGMPLSI
jgi:hypothetical protein